jgi:diguanylate cyclase (GGDEF)-like protein
MRQGHGVAGESHSPAGRLAVEVAELHAALLAKLRQELDDDEEAFAHAAPRLAREFGAIVGTAVDAASGSSLQTQPALADNESMGQAPRLREEPQELASLYRPGHMRRRLDQLVETNRRYGHPFGIAVFDASGPGARNGGSGPGQETILAIVGAALRDSIRIVDEAFRLEEDAICILAPNQRTVEGMQMAERLLVKLAELEQAGGLRIEIAAGVVACPEHGTDAEELLRKADAAMWRARAVGQPVGVGDLQDR